MKTKNIEMGAGMSDQEIIACLRKLEALLLEINEIRELFGENQQLFGIEKILAQGKYKAFKEKLYDAYRVIDTRRGQATLSQTEKNYYVTSVRNVRKNIRSIKTNSAPDGAWRLALAEAANCVKWEMDTLHGQLKK